MRSKQFGFWTEARRKLLWQMMTEEPRKKTDKEIARFFGKPRYKIYMAFNDIKQMNAFSKTEHFNEEGIKVTIYSPGKAHGLEPRLTAKPSHSG